MKFKSADFPGLLALILVVASASAMAVPSAGWRLQFDGSAESDGELVLVVTPDGGTPEEIVVAIGRADSENQIAHKAMVALQQAASRSTRIGYLTDRAALPARSGGAARGPGQSAVVSTSERADSAS